VRGTVCRAIEHGRLTPYPDFGKATHSPLRALQAGEASGGPHRHYAIARLSQHCGQDEAISAEHTSGRMEADGPLRRVR